MPTWTNITFLGDMAVTLPLAAVMLVWLFTVHARRMACAWGGLFLLGLTVVAATKIAYVGWGVGSEALDFTGISGHAMRACAVLPVLGYLLTHRVTFVKPWVGVVAGGLLALLISVSRLVLHDHSLSEVMSGCVLGGMIAFGGIRLGAPFPNVHFSRWLWALSVLVLIPASHAEPAPTQEWINAVARYLSGRDVPHVPVVSDDKDAHEMNS